MGNGGPMQTVGYIGRIPSCRLSRGRERRLDHHVVVVRFVLTVGRGRELALVFLLGPHMPPGRASVEAWIRPRPTSCWRAVMIPILAGVWVFFGYALATFRDGGGGGGGRAADDR